MEECFFALLRCFGPFFWLPFLCPGIGQCLKQLGLLVPSTWERLSDVLPGHDRTALLARPETRKP